MLAVPKEYGWTEDIRWYSCYVHFRYKMKTNSQKPISTFFLLLMPYHQQYYTSIIICQYKHIYILGELI